MEVKGSGDPTTISVTERGGTWHNLFRLIPGFLADSPPPVIRGSKKPSSFGLSTDHSIAVVLPIAYKTTPLTSQTAIESKHHGSPLLSLAAKGLSIREQEKIHIRKAKLESIALETIFVKKNSRRRSHQIKKIESELDDEKKTIISKKEEAYSAGTMRLGSIDSPKLEPIFQNPISAPNIHASSILRTPPKSMVVGRLKHSRSVISAPTLRNLGNRKPKRGREFDIVRNDVVEYPLEQEPSNQPSMSSNIYDLLQSNNSELLAEEPTDVDTDIDADSGSNV